ncbi:Sulfur carrier protein ThiS [Thioalkalivibrio nitratireducens DSM 14787]|uniref:Sulfur carrier protein ThiS n=1 Tax=Thioalkalivibrio nitratireducens (strain DSM 14787 / UNIQEM 213 / ALEN2) TaxID=1255043 RepID=L0E1W9_THIND|nr:sulfur carrier protein ThiS [Thioalkalivibrio nitratireducens]AGA35288.1 Sulfur carrier protein ThiS [Thioalkalivibrio nitratireducens DSM 14787]
MQIILNGEPYTFAPPADSGAATLGQLLALLDLAGRRLAVEVNGELVPRGEHATFRLSPEDRVEIVQAIGGG